MNIDKLISQLQSRIDKNSELIREEEEDIAVIKRLGWSVTSDDKIILGALREKQTFDKRLLGVLTKQRRGNLWYTNSGYKEYKFRVSLCMLKNANNLDVGVDFL